MRHITSGHAEVENAQNAFCRAGGVQVVAKLLQPSSHWPLIKAVIGLIKNIAQCKATHGLLREHSAIHNLVGLLMRAFQDLQNVITYLKFVKILLDIIDFGIYGYSIQILV